jgi:hypothetical protein
VVNSGKELPMETIVAPTIKLDKPKYNPILSLALVKTSADFTKNAKDTTKNIPGKIIPITFLNLLYFYLCLSKATITHRQDL